ncbi:uncharacterized protein K489DRAFT_121775 [Dissoconium aciculare CBS 342.82]|uniref:Uncharacterized protein n=1 Tax=Dissoconium aciculare CBS 342.82 TaxID=1314786 RepID=A0A6J3MG48_9PEZI|nr:uncharacterized protein K489DRAFT_121775 [Dissoconium aciculare CBS 342.82]KAF1826644.1 hypothetical protein K489DRAFT_121775 [Dissoconium aciculare CBS 342.82]
MHASPAWMLEENGSAATTGKKRKENHSRKCTPIQSYPTFPVESSSSCPLVLPLAHHDLQNTHPKHWRVIILPSPSFRVDSRPMCLRLRLLCTLPRWQCRSVCLWGSRLFLSSSVPADDHSSHAHSMRVHIHTHATQLYYVAVGEPIAPTAPVKQRPTFIVGCLVLPCLPADRAGGERPTWRATFRRKPAALHLCNDLAHSAMSSEDLIQ